MRKYREIDAFNLYMLNPHTQAFAPLFVPGSSGSVDTLIAESPEKAITPTLVPNKEALQDLLYKGNTKLVVVDETEEDREHAPEVRCTFEYRGAEFISEMRGMFMMPVPGAVTLSEMVTTHASDHEYVIVRTNYKWYRFTCVTQMKSPTIRYIIDRVADWNDVGAIYAINSHDFLFNLPAFFSDDHASIEARVRGLLNDAAYRDWRFARIDATWSGGE